MLNLVIVCLFHFFSSPTVYRFEGQFHVKSCMYFHFLHKGCCQFHQFPKRSALSRPFWGIQDQNFMKYLSFQYIYFYLLLGAFWNSYLFSKLCSNIISGIKMADIVWYLKSASASFKYMHVILFVMVERFDFRGPKSFWLKNSHNAIWIILEYVLSNR